MRKDERTGLGLALAILTIALLGAGYAMPWWSFEESTGRQTAPGGPQDPADTQVVRGDIDFYADRWEGDIEPADAETATSVMETLRIAVYVAVAAMGLYILGQIPGVSRIITRPWCIGLATIALAAVLTALVYGWVRLPEAMASKGVDGPFTSLKLEAGYIRTNLNAGWAAAAFASVSALGTLFGAYSAGNADPRVIEEYSAV